MAEIFFQSNFTNMQGYETDTTQEPITSTVVQYITPSFGLPLYFYPATGVSPTSGQMEINPNTTDESVILNNLTPTPRMVAKFYPLLTGLTFQIPIIPEGINSLVLLTEPSTTIQNYYIELYLVPIADAIADTVVGSPPIGQMIARSVPVVIPGTNILDKRVLTISKIYSPQLSTSSYTISFVIYAYGEGGNFEMVVGDSPSADNVSYARTTIPIK